MTMTTSSTKFKKIYDALPAHAQQNLTTDHLIALLDIVPKDKAKNILLAATRARKRCNSIPVLDIKAKETELDSLMQELRRDAKFAIIKGVSRREELLEEAVQSLLQWLNDIWTITYEHGVDFALAHRCLLFTSDILQELGHSRADCNCEFMNILVTLKIKNKNGNTVRSFAYKGAHHTSRMILWIWRDLFLSMLASNPPPQSKTVMEMLSEIDNSMGWLYVHRLLYGGRKSRCCQDCDNDDDEEDDDGIDQDVYWEDEDYTGHCSCCEFDSDDSDNDSEDSCYDDDHCHTTRVRASHWSKKIKEQSPKLLYYVSEYLTSVFKVTPSLPLFRSIIEIHTNDTGVIAQHLHILQSIATTNLDNFAAALDILASERNAKSIASLLDSHSHLLRPRDAPAHQSAVHLLSTRPAYHLRALQILEKEFIDTAHSLSLAITSAFSSISKQPHKLELARITKIRLGSQPRADRVRRWVDAVITPGSFSPHPLAFAALMMGFPFLPQTTAADTDTDNGPDPYAYLDVDQHDKDLDDLRDEHRPKLKDRFDGWNATAQLIKGGPGLLFRIHTQILELMPFIQASDVVDEMISRLVDQPSKLHICDALSTLSNFNKTHAKKIRKPSPAQKQTKQPAQAAQQIPQPATTPSTAASESAASAVLSMTEVGGMDDVD